MLWTILHRVKRVRPIRMRVVDRWAGSHNFGCSATFEVWLTQTRNPHLRHEGVSKTALVWADKLRVLIPQVSLRFVVMCRV